MRTSQRAVVVCIGNELVADDAVGCAVHRLLVERGLPPGVRLELLAVGGLRLLDVLQGEELLVVVDAVRLGTAPGTIHDLDWSAIPAAPGRAVSSHGIGVREAIEVARRIMPECAPERISLIGIEGRRFSELDRMSPEVENAVPAAADAVVERLARPPVF